MGDHFRSVELFESSNSKRARKEECQKILLGHSGRCFDVRSKLGCILSASEGGLNLFFNLLQIIDGTSKLWSISSTGGYSCISTFNHCRSAEVLRSCFLFQKDSSSIVCTAGSDGNIIVWKRSENDETTHNFSKLCTVRHAEKSQIYTCEPLVQNDISASDRFFSAADDSKLYIWDLNQLSSPLEWYHYICILIY